MRYLDSTDDIVWTCLRRDEIRDVNIKWERKIYNDETLTEEEKVEKLEEWKQVICMPNELENQLVL